MAEAIHYVGCSRCWRAAEEGMHPGIEWHQFVHPVEDADGTVWTQWATCPETGDPILGRMAPTEPPE